MEKKQEEFRKGLKLLGVGVAGFLGLVAAYGVYTVTVRSEDVLHDYEGKIDSTQVERHRLRNADWPFTPWDEVTVSHEDGSKTRYLDDEPFGSLDQVVKYSPKGEEVFCQGEHDNEIAMDYCKSVGDQPGITFGRPKKVLFVDDKYQQEFNSLNGKVDKALKEAKEDTKNSENGKY